MSKELDKETLQGEYGILQHKVYRERKIAPVREIIERWRDCVPSDFKPQLESDRWHGYRFNFYDEDAGIDLYQFCYKEAESELNSVKRCITHKLQLAGTYYSVDWEPEWGNYTAHVKKVIKGVPIFLSSGSWSNDSAALLEVYVKFIVATSEADR